MIIMKVKLFLKMTNDQMLLIGRVSQDKGILVQIKQNLLLFCKMRLLIYMEGF